MGSTRIFDNQISCKDSLRNIIEFAYTDPDICKGDDNRKLIRKINLGKTSSKSKDTVYNLMVDGCRKWTKEKQEEFVYIIYAWEKDEVWPEDIYDLFIRYTSEYFAGLPTLLSVHEDESGVYVHLLVRKVVDGEVLSDYMERLNFPDCFYRHRMKDTNVSFQIKDYCDLIQYMIY